jgi:hypothetical protein
VSGILVRFRDDRLAKTWSNPVVDGRSGMDATAAAVLVLAGSAIFLVGAGIGVPRVFTEPNVAERVRLLDSHRAQWRIAQPLYAIGPLVAVFGIGALASGAEERSERIWLALSCLLLLAGAICWSWSVYMRFRHAREFALGELPGWSFACYVWLTLAGLALLGIGLLVAVFPSWTGWLTLTACLAFTVVYARFRDLPPFVFYTLLPVVSLGWL